MKAYETPRIVPINEYEAIIEPFWDRHLSGLAFWTMLVPGEVVINDKRGDRWNETISDSVYDYGESFLFESSTDHGLKIGQTWCSANYEWLQKPENGIALEMERTFDLPLDGYEWVAISMTLPPDSTLAVLITTEAGVREERFPCPGLLKDEFRIPTRGARRLHALRITIRTESDRISRGLMNWIGLGGSPIPRGPGMTTVTDRWANYLVPESAAAPRFRPQFGILLDDGDVEVLQARYSESLARGVELPCVTRIRTEIPRDPEGAISTHIKLWGDNRYCRAADHHKRLLGYAHEAAMAATISRDAALLRLAARYALSIAFTPSWHDGFLCEFPGSVFECKGFTHSLCTFELAVILDIAWDLFTPNARQLILRRIGETGIGNLNWTVWKHGAPPENIFAMNQLAWFSPGRIAGSLIMEKVYKNVSRHTDLYVEDLIESINTVVLPDGGYHEGAGYFGTVAESAALSIYMYAKQRDTDYRAILPDVLHKTADFIEVFESTDDEKDVIPISDGRPTVNAEYPVTMASLMPASRWSALYRKVVGRTGGRPDTVIAELLSERVGTDRAAPRAFVHLPVMGFVSSVRTIADETLKIVIPGNHEAIGHSHEDKGSFVLEFGGQTFFMDPGIGDYSNQAMMRMKFCQYHNMLLPYGTPGRPAPEHPLPYAVKPTGDGDERRFHATIDATKGWEAYYRRWRRSFRSDTPDVLTVIDEYELASGDGVEFVLNTSLPVRCDSATVEVHGRRGRARIDIPQGCTCRIENPESTLDPDHRRIILRYPHTEGRLSVPLHFSVR